MIRISGLTSFLMLFFLTRIFSQTAIVKGKIKDEQGEPLAYTSIHVQGSDRGTVSDQDGNYRIKTTTGKIVLVFSYLGKQTEKAELELSENQEVIFDVSMKEKTEQVDSVVVRDKKAYDDASRDQVSMTKIDPRIPKYIPSAFGDFNKVLATLPGVVTNNELSSQYIVRGGNYDENQVYVNGMEVYRPFLVRAGQQEGLSFINPDLVSDVEFSAGGWQSRYGDKLSSVLSVKYKEPKKFRASASASLLGGTAHIENGSKNGRISYVVGARRKSSQYLLNTLPVKGQYKPRFDDFQSYLTIDLTHRKDSNDRERRTTLGILSTYAYNNYVVTPTSEQTSFGTLSQVMDINVNYYGKQTLQYSTAQGGVNLFHKFSNKVKSEFILSGMHSTEQEKSDVLDVYSLSDVTVDPNTGINTSSVVVGAGANFQHQRNALHATVINFLHRGYYTYNSKNKFEWGYGQSYEHIKDSLSEYYFSDSADYINITQRINTHADLNSFRSQAYAQHTIQPDSNHTLTYGTRLGYWTLNHQLLCGPRVQYAWRPGGSKNLTLKAAAGLYQQPPFYRELRDTNGVVHTNVKAQNSYQVIVGGNYIFKGIDGRPFKFTSEFYYKYLTNVDTYYMVDVMLRYLANNNAVAYARGADFRLNGEFLKGTESWFSLSFLSTKENYEGTGWVRRPTDQHVTAAVYFQDQLPRNPSMKVFLNLVYGSGLPFGPPYIQKYKDAFSGPAYKRVDIGFSKLITFNDKATKSNSVFESVWISLEVLNLFGVNNVISYLWISDYSGNQYAVPNALSARYVNLRTIVRF